MDIILKRKVGGCECAVGGECNEEGIEGNGTFVMLLVIKFNEEQYSGI